jgi:histidyl-tRNA synthetase
MSEEIRAAGMRAEVFVGSGNLTKQMKYADKRGIHIAVIMGEDELAKGEVTIKDLYLGAEMAKAISSNEEWKSSRPAQQTIARSELISTLKAALKPE